jgi:hypothetical protein
MGWRFASEFSVDLSLILTAARFLGGIGDVEGMHSSPTDEELHALIPN